MTATTKPITAEELFAMGDVGRCELIRGEIRHMAPPGPEHADVTNLLQFHLTAFVQANRLGKVFAELGYLLARDPDLVRAPDVSFLRTERIPSRFAKGFFPGPPDLAIEVVSPNDLASEVLTKVEEWLTAGVTSVWVTDPASRSIVIHRRGIKAFRFRSGDTITDEPTLPGFTLDLRSIFES